MGVVHTPDSKFAQEMRKHEAHHSVFGPPGRPYVKRDYPMMLHLGGRDTSGSPAVIETRIVDDEAQARNLKSRGFCEGPNEALEEFHRRETETATIAANRVFNEQGMTEKAKREAASADAATPDHLPSVPVTPIKKRGRPVKHQTADAGGV